MVVFNSITAAPVRGLLPIRGTKRQKPSLALPLYFIVFSGSIYLLFGTFYDGSLSEKSGESPLYLSLLFLTYSVMLYQLAFVRVVALRTVLKSVALLMFVSSGIVSLITAGAAGVSVMRFVLYIVTISAGLLISSRYSLDEFCESFFYTSFAITIAHFLAYPLLAGRIVYDPLARETLLGLTSYAGLFPHKSVAATFFSLSLIISLARYFGSRAATTRRSSIILAWRVSRRASDFRRCRTLAGSADQRASGPATSRIFSEGYCKPDSHRKWAHLGYYRLSLDRRW